MSTVGAETIPVGGPHRNGFRSANRTRKPDASGNFAVDEEIANAR